jgi:hypothetical protein
MSVLALLAENVPSESVVNVKVPVVLSLVSARLLGLLVRVGLAFDMDQAMVLFTVSFVSDQSVLVLFLRAAVVV